MPYPPLTGKRLLVFLTSEPLTQLSPCVGLLVRAYPHGDAHSELWRLREAQIDFRNRHVLLDWCHSDLVRLAKENYEAYEPHDVPAGYASAGYASERPATAKAYEAEALISMYLDGAYIVSDHLVKLTRTLCCISGGNVWANKVPPPKGRPRDVWYALLKDYGASSNEASGKAELCERVCRIRGRRTHARHFEVYLEHTEGEHEPIIVYATENPYITATPDTMFNDLDRREWSKDIEDLLTRWSETTQAMLARVV